MPRLLQSDPDPGHRSNVPTAADRRDCDCAQRISLMAFSLDGAQHVATGVAARPKDLRTKPENLRAGSQLCLMYALLTAPSAGMPKSTLRQRLELVPPSARLASTVRPVTGAPKALRSSGWRC